MTTADDEIEDSDCPADEDSHQVYSKSQILLNNPSHSVSGLWLQLPVCQVAEFKVTKEEFMDKWADRCQQTYAECSVLSQATADKIASSFGEAVDNAVPSMRFLSAQFADNIQPEAHYSDYEPLGLIQMIRKTDLKL